MTRADLFAYLRAHCRDAANVTPLPVIARAVAGEPDAGPARVKALTRQVQAIVRIDFCCQLWYYISTRQGDLFVSLRKAIKHNWSIPFGPSGRRTRSPWRVYRLATEGLFVCEEIGPC